MWNRNKCQCAAECEYECMCEWDVTEEHETTSVIQSALFEAMQHALLYGHGFVRVTHDNGMFEIAHIKDDDLAELLKFMKEQKRVEL